MEDYSHSFEHTVELQVIFLRHVLGPGNFCRRCAHSIYNGGDPKAMTK